MMGFMAALVQGGLLSRLMRHVGERRLIVAGLLSSTLAFMGYGLTTHGAWVYAIIAANLLAFTVQPALNALVSKAAPPQGQGAAMGALTALSALMGVVAPLLGGPLLAHVSHFAPVDWRVGAPYFLSAALSALALGVAVRFFARAPKGLPVTAAHD